MTQLTAKNMSRELIYRLAVAYVDRYASFDVTDKLCDEYSISKQTFYRVLGKAIVEGIVGDDTALIMAEKAKANTEMKVGKKGVARTKRRYFHLMEQRKTYQFPKKEATLWTMKYADSELDKKEFCIRNRITTKLFDRTVRTAIVEDWVLDEVVEKLKSKSLARFSDEKTKQFWQKLEQLRNENKNHK